jgi:hypothetical protein
MDLEYRGIRFSVRKIGPTQWHWEIYPPSCVRGLHSASGTIEGDTVAVTEAAKREIDRQSDGPKVVIAPSPSKRASGEAPARIRLASPHASSD